MAFSNNNNVGSFESPLLSVQELIKKEPLTSVPHRYIIRVDDHNDHDLDLDLASSLPILNETLSLEIPTINMKRLINHGEDDAQLELHKLSSACREWGFFQLVDHGISREVLAKLREGIEGFFNLPLEEKMKYKIRAGDVEGYGRVNLSEDQTLEWSDRLFMRINPITTRKPHLLPHLPSPLRKMLESYTVECGKIGMKLVGMMGKALKIEKGEWEEVLDDGMQNVRMTYYPPCPQPELVMGLRAHSDASGITILNQVNGVNGLQINKNGVWLPVKVSSDALLVNVGDILEMMSNGAYKSVEHRATVNSEKERISIAMFFLPKLECEIGPTISLTNPQNPPLFKRIAMEKYVKDYFTQKRQGKSYLEEMKIITP